MLKVVRHINELMSSNCYIVYDERFDDCIVIDPASEKCLQEISLFQKERVKPAYVILTHEHTDHTWGVNTLIEKYEPLVICSRVCAKNLARESCAYFSLYYDNPNYSYNVKKVDIYTENLSRGLIWHDFKIEFISVPGHSMGSICILLNHYLFTGDTWMPFSPYISKRNGSKSLYRENFQKLKDRFFNTDVLIMPGHGDMFQPL